jgi:PAS domain S-box-containing protein
MDVKSLQMNRSIIRLISFLAAFLSFLLLTTGGIGTYMISKFYKNLDNIHYQVMLPSLRLQTINYQLGDLYKNLAKLKMVQSKAAALSKLEKELKKSRFSRFNIEQDEKGLEKREEVVANIRNIVIKVNNLLEESKNASKGLSYFNKLIFWRKHWTDFYGVIEKQIGSNNTSDKELLRAEKYIDNLRQRLQEIGDIITAKAADDLEASESFATTAISILMGVVFIGLIIAVIISIRTVKDVRRVLDQLEKSNQEQQQLAQIVANANDGIVSIDMHGNIQSWNSAATKILGYSVADAKGHQISAIFGDDPARGWENYRDLLKKKPKASLHDENFLYTKRGVQIEAQISLSSLQDNYQGMTGLAMMIQDITEKKRIERALREEEEKERERIEEELKTAKTVQEMLFPPLLAQLEGVEIAGHFESATDLGGDWWFYSELSDRILFWIGDATGHGVPAALLTSAARASAAIIDKINRMSPAKALSILNAAICASARGTMLMTFFMASYDKKSRELTYSNAGHDPPYIFNFYDEKLSVKKLIPLNEVNAPRLGQDVNTVFSNHRLTVEKDQAIIFYTDGLTELENSDGKQWGEMKFLKSVVKGVKTTKNTQKTVEFVLDKINDHRDNYELQDDVTYFISKFV